jgi:general L-amino acid transport system ATP-binding protein
MASASQSEASRSEAPFSVTHGSSVAPDPIAVYAANIVKSYGTVRVLDDIGATLQRGSKTVICGPSGSGKSTFMRCLSGLEKRNAGTVRLLGRDVKPDGSSVRDFAGRVGMVFQSFNLFPHLTVLENLILAQTKVRKLSRRLAEEVAADYLNRVRMPGSEQRYPSQLSGGQQQRVAIARTLCMQPEIIFFDEPTSALDPEMVSEVLDIMTLLASSGITMVVVTHEMSFARRVADSVIFLDCGRIAEVSPPERFFSAPSNPRAAEFLGSLLGR